MQNPAGLGARAILGTLPQELQGVKRIDKGPEVLMSS
jgi:hypothetical protein